MKKYFVVGILLLGFLPFSFSQEFDFRKTVETRFKGKHRSEEFKSFLDSMKLNGEDYFNENCSQYASWIRNDGRIKAYQGVAHYADAYSRYYDAYKHIKSCEKVDPEIYLQILMSLDVFERFKKIETIPYSQRIEEIISLVNSKENNLDEDFEKLSANAHHRLCHHYRYDLKDYDRALIHGRKSNAIYNKYGIVDKKALRAINSLIVTYTDAGKIDKALKYIEQSLKYAKQLQLTENRSDLQFKIGRIYLDREDYPKLDSLHSAIEIEYPNNNFYQLYFQKAMASFNKGEYLKANKLFSKTMDMIRKYGDNSQQVLIREITNFQSDCMLHTENYKEALEYAKVAMNESTVRLEIDPKTKCINFEDLIIVQPLEFVYSANKYIESVADGEMISEQDLIKTIDKFDSIYYNIQPSIVGPIASNSLANNYHTMVGVVLRRMFKTDLSKNSDFISYYLSSGKSLALFSNYIIEENIPDSLSIEFERLNTAKYTISSLLEEYNKLNNQEKVDSLSNAFYENNLKLKSIYNSLNTVSLDSDFRANRGSLVDRVNRTFGQEDLVIDFFEYEDHYYAFSIFNKEQKFHSFSMKEYESINLKDVFTNLSLYKDLDKVTNSFFTLIKPLFPSDLEKIQSISIIADGQLVELPFETIRIDNKFLIEKFPLYYINSLNDHFNRIERKVDNKFNYVGYAMQYDETILEQISNSKELNSLFDKQFRLTALPSSINEVATVKSLLGGKSFLNNNCSVDAFINNSTNSKIIHIANHVLLNEQNSSASAIVFSNDSEFQLFDALEIKSLNLKSDLAILSSCNSGVGNHFQGNGVRSIGQSFFEAGVNSVLVNLWEAGDKSSQKIVTKFIENLKEGHSKSEALRLAKIDFLSQASDSERHPKFWSNIILIGQNDSVDFNKSISGLKYLLILPVLLIVYLIYKRSRK